MNIVFPSNTKTVIDAIRTAIGRDVEFHYVVSSYECPNCDLDPVTNTSDNSFCTVCSGTYYIDIISGYTVPAVITWDPSDKTAWYAGGTISDGDCLIQVEVTDEILGILPTVVDVTVDGKLLEVKKKRLRGVKNINRILMSLKEK